MRRHFQLFLGWYTFFLTVNFGAIGWFTSVMLTGALEVSLPVLFIALFFVVQLIFPYLASRAVRDYLVDTDRRMAEIVRELLPNWQEAALLPRPPFPLKV
ncbi:hypothetical protein GMST_06820 [Geomonas silvestris]|uniref:Uncharacterized protein n=1 Tax=Geomonas silvestris TaxID=2740184 RepID=A0A6V8MEG5_9BACT|nr:hypothetical protein [Geomonas silvestris]GFO58357.1 hypothetical protein GMST_06820 [Geomonas silvestris]